VLSWQLDLYKSQCKPAHAFFVVPLSCRRACEQGKHGGHTIPRVKTLGDLCTAFSMRLETMKVRSLLPLCVRTLC
jgi:hypothetical protein